MEIHYDGEDIKHGGEEDVDLVFGHQLLEGVGHRGGARQSTEEPAVAEPEDDDHDDDDNGDGDIAQPALVDIVLARALHHQLRLGEEDARAHPLDL